MYASLSLTFMLTLYSSIYFYVFCTLVKVYDVGV